MFLTPEELEQLTGYTQNQRARTRRWLLRNGIPFTENRLGDPVVLRSDVESGTNKTTTPNFDFLRQSA